MDLNAVFVFVRVAEAESFTTAAATLGLPKSSVSRSVAKLEEALGVRLLHRTTRKLSLTEAGRLYFERARSAMTTLDDASAAAGDMGKAPRGTVKVTAPVDAGVSILAGVIARFGKQHPGIHIELHLTARVVNLVEEGFDLAFRAGRLDDSSLIARRVGEGELALFASPRYLRRRGRPKKLADLASHDCVLFRPVHVRGTWRLNGPNGEETVQVTGPVDADDLSFVREALLNDIGIGLVPAFYCADAVRARTLIRVLPDYTHRAGAFHVVSPSRHYEPARVILFRDFLIAELSAIDWKG